MAPKAIHEHTTNCPQWQATRGAPWPYFKFSAKPENYSPIAIEGKDFVRCYVCLQHGWDFRFLRMAQHLQVHNLTEEAYLAAYQGALIRLGLTTERREASVKAKYGVSNVFQDEGIKAKSRQSMIDRWGAASPMQTPELKRKAADTNLERYGAENVFGAESIQAKIQATNLAKFGVPNPNQSPEVIARRVSTNLERYGKNHFVETDEFKTKFVATSMAHYGVEHPMKSEQVRNVFEGVFLAKYGVRSPGGSPILRLKGTATARSHHDGLHPLSHPRIIEARKQTLLAKYGVDNISKVPHIKEKIIASITARFRSGAVPKMTVPERILDGLTNERVVYSGNWTYWVTWANGRRKNPDFVVLTKEQLAAYRSGVPLKDLRTHLVIEENGVWWHTKNKGFTREQREKEFVDGYASIGVTCLVIWEDTILGDPDGVASRVQSAIAVSHL